MCAKDEVMLTCGMLCGWIIELLGATWLCQRVLYFDLTRAVSKIHTVPLMSLTHSINQLNLDLKAVCLFYQLYSNAKNHQSYFATQNGFVLIHKLVSLRNQYLMSYLCDITKTLTFNSDFFNVIIMVVFSCSYNK